MNVKKVYPLASKHSSRVITLTPKIAQLNENENELKRARIASEATEKRYNRKTKSRENNLNACLRSLDRILRKKHANTPLPIPNLDRLKGARDKFATFVRQQLAYCCVCDTPCVTKPNLIDLTRVENIALREKIVQICHSDNYRSCLGKPLHTDFIKQYDISGLFSDSVLQESLRGVLLSPRGVSRNVENSDNLGFLDFAEYWSDDDYEEALASLNVDDEIREQPDEDSPQDIAPDSPDIAFQNLGNDVYESNVEDADFDWNTFLPELSPTENCVIMCNDCLRHLSKPQCSSPPQWAVVNGLAIGTWPAEYRDLVQKDCVRNVLRQVLAVMRIKTYYFKSPKTQRIVGLVSMIDISESLANTINSLCSDASLMLQIYLCKSLNEQDKKWVITQEEVKKSDLDPVIDYIAERNPHILQDEVQRKIRVYVKKDDGSLAPYTSHDFEVEPDIHTGVAGDATGEETDLTKPVLIVRHYAHIDGEDCSEVRACLKEKLETSTPYSLGLYPGKKYVNLNDDLALERCFSDLFLNGDVSKPPNTSFDTYLRVLMLKGVGTFNDGSFAAAVYTHLIKQKTFQRVGLEVKNNISFISESTRFSIDKGYIYYKDSSNDRIRAIPRILAHLDGSDEQRLHFQKEILALIYAFGAPTLFFTMSPDPSASFTLFNNDKLDVPAEFQFKGSFNLFSANGTFLKNLNGSGSLPSKSQCVSIALKDQMACFQYFQRCMKGFFEVFLGYGSDDGALGPVDYYFASVETNSRGFLHFHSLIRLKSMPKGIYDFNLNQSLHEELVAFIEAAIHTGYPGISDSENLPIICPGCSSTNSLTPLPPLSLAYSTTKSLALPPPVTTSCMSCHTSWTSGDVVRCTAMKSLFPDSYAKKQQREQTATAYAGPRPVFSRDEVVQVMLALSLGAKIDGKASEDFLLAEAKYDAFRSLLINWYQEHLATHTSSCFKKGTEDCRYRFPRPVMPETCIDDSGEFFLKRSLLFEFTNYSLQGVLDLALGNQDVASLLSGNIVSNALFYIAKYVGKRQKPLDSAPLQQALLAKLQELNVALDTFATTESEPDRVAARKALSSLILNLQQYQEHDPQMTIFHIMVGKPQMSSHQFKTVSLYKLIREIDKKPNTPFLLPSRNGGWTTIRDFDYNYRNRPQSLKNLCLYHYACHFQYNRNARSLTLTQEQTIPVVNPLLPNLLYEYLEAAPVWNDHSKCTPDRCQPLPRQSKVSILSKEGTCLHDIGKPKMYDDDELAEDEIDDLLDEADSLFERDSFSSDIFMDLDDEPIGDPFAAPTSLLDRQEFFGRIFCLLFKPWRSDVHRLKDYRCETFWDAANRYLDTVFQASQDPHRQDYGRSIDILQYLINFNNNLRPPQQRSDQEKITKAFLEAASQDRRLQQGQPPSMSEEEVASNVENPLHDMMTESLNATLAEEANEQTKQDRREADVVVSKLMRGFRISQEVAHQFPRIAVQTLYKAPPVADVEGTASVAVLATGLSEDASPALVIEKRATILFDVGDEYSLEYEQRFLFYLLATKFLKKNAPDFQFTAALAIPDDLLNRQLLIKVAGAGGTGKSRILKAIKHLAKMFGKPNAVQTMSHMGVAAVNAEGVTVHSKMGFLKSRQSKKRLEGFRQELQDADFLVLDECFLTGKVTLARVNETLKMCLNPSEIMGGMDVILMGDPMQFDPIKDRSLLDPLSPQSTSEEIRGDVVMKSFKDTVFLRKNFRAAGDKQFIQDLADIRQQSTFDDDTKLNALLQRLNARHVDETAQETRTSYALVVTSTNRKRMALDDSFFGSFRTAGIRTFKFPFLPTKDGRILTEKEIFLVKGEHYSTGSSLKAPPEVELFIGQPVTLTVNGSRIHQQYGFSNGSHGHVVGFQWPEGGSTSQMPECIFVKMETPTPHRIQGLPEGVLPIPRMRFQGKTREKRQAAFSASVSYSFWSFPLKPRLASTFESTQCLTINNLVIDLNFDGRGSPARKKFYVGMSRAQAWNQIRTLQKLTLDEIRKLRPSDKDVAMVHRLEDQSKATFIKYSVPQELIYPTLF